jgi:hypothetical protein
MQNHGIWKPFEESPQKQRVQCSLFSIPLFSLGYRVKAQNGREHCPIAGGFPRKPLREFGGIHSGFPHRAARQILADQAGALFWIPKIAERASPKINEKMELGL